MKKDKKIKPVNKIEKWTFKQASDWFMSFPMVKAFYLEGKDYKEMISIFSILLMEKLNIKHRHDIPSSLEVKEAIKQLKDVPKIMPFCVLFLAPIPGILTSYTLLSYLIYRLSNKQINILPDRFNIVVDELKDKKIFSFLNKNKKNKKETNIKD